MNKRFLKLFERVMSELLAMQRNKFASMADELERLREAAEELLDKMLAEKSRREHLERHVKELQDRNDQLAAMLKIKDSEITSLQDQIETLEREAREHMAYLEELRSEREKWEKEREELERRLKAEEAASIEAMLKEAREQMQREFDLLLEREREKFAKLKEQLDEMTKLYRAAQAKLEKKIHILKVEKAQQTEVDENGLWDKQDGWTMPISATRVIRSRWRAALDFARCPSCRGSGKFVASVAGLLRRMARGQIEDNFTTKSKPKEDKQKVVWNGSRYIVKKKKKATITWTIPDELVQFLVNLPRTIQAKRHHSMPWVLKRVWKLMQLKSKADAEDSMLGYTLQPFSEFLIEAHLERSKLRTGAELNIYMLLVSLKEVYKQHPLLHSFARFLALLEDPNEQGASGSQESSTSVDGGDGSIRKSKVDETQEAAKNHFAVHNSPLALNVLSVYLFARDCLLHETYDGRYAAAIENVKTSNTNPKMREKFKKMNKEEKLKYIDNCLHKAEKEIVDGWWLTEEAVMMKMTNQESNDDIPLQLKHDHADQFVEEHQMKKMTCDEESAPTAPSTSSIDLRAPNPISYLNVDTTNVGASSTLPAISDWGIKIPTHVCVADSSNGRDSYHFWIPMDRAVQVLVSMLSFMSEEESVEVLRVVEKDACFLTSTGKLVPPDANHSVVRLAMRQFIKIYSGFREGIFCHRCSHTLSNKIINQCHFSLLHLFEYNEGKTSFELSTEDRNVLMGGTKDADFIIMVNMDKVLNLLIEVVRTRISFVEESLAKIYTEGDDNGDGVLSFQEFLGIVTKVAPHYPRRRVLKMFREALQIGDGDSIDKNAFVTVCKRHDLVQLVDLVSLRNGALASLQPLNVADETLTNSPKGKSPTRKEQNDSDKRLRKSSNSWPIREKKGLVSMVRKNQALKTMVGIDASGAGVEVHQLEETPAPSRVDSMMQAIAEQNLANSSFDSSVQSKALGDEGVSFAGGLRAAIGVARLAKSKSSQLFAGEPQQAEALGQQNILERSQTMNALLPSSSSGNISCVEGNHREVTSLNDDISGDEVSESNEKVSTMQQRNKNSSEKSFSASLFLEHMTHTRMEMQQQRSKGEVLSAKGLMSTFDDEFGKSRVLVSGKTPSSIMAAARNILNR